MAGLDELKNGRLSLGALWRRFSTQCQAYLDNKPPTQADAVLRAKVLVAHFGETCDVNRLTADDVQAFRVRRLAGGLKVGERVLLPCRERSVEADLVLLTQMLRWATTVWQDGRRWLAANPIAGVARHRERNPRRPVATVERFHGTLRAMQGLGQQAQTEEERVRWLRMELALRLAEATGRRLGSIRQLCWEDVDAEAATIRWRAEHDKKGREAVIPYPATLFADLRRLQGSLGAIGGWVFAGERRPEQPMDRHLFDKWLTVAERTAGQLKLEGGTVAPVPARVGDRPQAPPGDGCGPGGRLDRCGDAASLLSATRKGNAPPSHLRGAQTPRQHVERLSLVDTLVDSGW